MERAVQNVQELGTSKWCVGDINRTLQWGWLSGASVNGRKKGREKEGGKKRRGKKKKKGGGAVMMYIACLI